MNILLFIDNLTTAEQVTKLLLGLDYPVETKITLLTIYENEKDQFQLENILNDVKRDLSVKYLHIQTDLQPGHVIEKLIEESSTHAYDFIVTGTEIHQGHFHFRNDSFPRKLSREINLPLLIARNVPEKIEKILFCTSAEAPSLDTLRIAGRLLSGLKVEFGLLHVMSQLALRPDSLPDDLLDTAESAIQRNTREGLQLVKGMQILASTGIDSKITPCLRHGLVIDQVLIEIEEGTYDLVVIGEHYRHGLNRWLEVLLDDVAGQLLIQSPRSILII
jgi:nucleotide-binding universal stress UspA family protein